jgi:hypothetical protein
VEDMLADWFLSRDRRVCYYFLIIMSLTHINRPLCYRLMSFQTYHSPHQRWLTLKPEKATVIVDNLVTQDLTTIPFFRETTATPINLLFGQGSPIIRSSSDHPPIGPDPRQPPTNSIVTPAQIWTTLVLGFSLCRATRSTSVLDGECK